MATSLALSLEAEKKAMMSLLDTRDYVDSLSKLNEDLARSPAFPKCRYESIVREVYSTADVLLREERGRWCESEEAVSITMDKGFTPPPPPPPQLSANNDANYTNTNNKSGCRPKRLQDLVVRLTRDLVRDPSNYFNYDNMALLRRIYDVVISCFWFTPKLSCPDDAYNNNNNDSAIGKAVSKKMRILRSVYFEETANVTTDWRISALDMAIFRHDFVGLVEVHRYSDDWKHPMKIVTSFVAYPGDTIINNARELIRDRETGLIGDSETGPLSYTNARSLCRYTRQTHARFIVSEKGGKGDGDENLRDRQTDSLLSGIARCTY